MAEVDQDLLLGFYREFRIIIDYFQGWTMFGQANLPETYHAENENMDFKII